MTKLEYFKAKVDAALSPVDFIYMSEDEKKDIFFLDVRTAPSNILKEKIKGATLIPLNILCEHLDRIPSEKKVVIYGWGEWDNVASKGAIILLENGIDVMEISGGLTAWKTMNFPVENV